MKHQLPEENPIESKDCTEATQDLTDDESTTESLTHHSQDWIQAFYDIGQILVTAIMDFFENAYSDDFFLDSHDRGDYSKAVASLMMS